MDEKEKTVRQDGVKLLSETQQKLEFNLHVALIQKVDNVNKSKATFKAWLEGPEGLAQRLAKM